jgi:hypothetical protein
MKWRGRLWASLGLVWSAVAAAGDDPSIPVEVRQCGNLDASRIRALFELELGEEVEGLGSQSLTVTCAPSEIRLKVESSRMGWIERVLKTPLAREEPERIVALAAAQLVLAAWVEAPRHRPVPEAPRPFAPPQPEALAPSTGSNTLDMEVDAGLRARSLDRVAIGPAFGLAGIGWRGHWGALVGASTDRVTESRALGGVELMVTELELAGSWRSSVDRPFSFELSLGPALALVNLRGIDPVASVRAGAVTAATMDAKARAALRYRRGWLSLRAAIDGGYLFSGAEGTISADKTILARGPWAGFTLSGGAAW